MSKFKKEGSVSTEKYRDGYDIFDDKDILIDLENEIKTYGDFYKLCESKGWIRIYSRKNEIIYVTVNPDTAFYFTDYCARNKALQKRQDYYRQKQEEADKQRLL